MPLPWKKSRVSRFSRIVADLHSPNRGNSLVVETGFPTSLVDLFVKNRERLKKPSKKKQKKKHQQQQEGFVDDLVISDPIPLSSSRDLVGLYEPLYVDNGTQKVENSGGLQESFGRSELVGELPSVEKCAVLDVNGNRLNENGKRLLLVVLKMLVVVILCLSTKKLAVGITTSASVLIFLEYVGKHILCFLRPCSNAVSSFQPWMPDFLLILKRVKNWGRSIKGLIIQEDKEVDVVGVADSCDLIGTLESNTCVKEIQVVESNLDMVTRVEENRGTEIDSDLVNCAWRLGGLGMETKVGVQRVDQGGIEVLAGGKESRRSTMIKTTIIKKLVPKKLRRGKKSKKTKEKELDLSCEVASCWGENQLRGNEALEQHKGQDGLDLEVKSKLLTPELLEEEGEKKRRYQQFNDGISVSSTELQARVEMIIVEERLEIERKGNSGYLILCVIVLTGLLGGRILALALTLVSCLMFKLVKR